MWGSTIGCIVTLILSLLTVPLTSQAQQTAQVPRLGLLMVGSASGFASGIEAFQQGLRDLSYVEGQNIILEYRYAEGRFERLPALVAELMHLKVDVLVTSGSQSVQALKQATSTIPIVGVILADPVGTGFATSFARLGGNITGLAFQNTDISTKRLELLKEAVPRVTRIAVLRDIHHPASASAVRATQEVARSLGLQLHLLEVRGPDDFDSAFGPRTRGVPKPSCRWGLRSSARTERPS